MFPKPWLKLVIILFDLTANSQRMEVRAIESQDSVVTIHMVCSLDGFIADENDQCEWLNTSDHFAAGAKHEDLSAFLESVDCWVIGSRTFESALRLGWPYGEKTTYVLTSRSLSKHQGSIHFRDESLAELMKNELRVKHQNIWICGGARVAQDALQSRIADRVCITIAPIILGGGLHFFGQIGRSIPLHLEEVKAFETGFVEISYSVMN